MVCLISKIKSLRCAYFIVTIYQATGSKFLIKVNSNLRAIVMGMRARSIQADRKWLQVWDEHSRLIEHLERGEKERAVKLIKEHVTNAAAHAFSVIQMQDEDAARIKADPVPREATNKNSLIVFVEVCGLFCCDRS